jgi:hypothetical protein
LNHTRATQLACALWLHRVKSGQQSGITFLDREDYDEEYQPTATFNFSNFTISGSSCFGLSVYVIGAQSVNRRTGLCCILKTTLFSWPTTQKPSLAGCRKSSLGQPINKAPYNFKASKQAIGGS